MDNDLNAQLIQAVQHADASEVSFLLNQGADVNAVNAFGNSAIMIAAEAGYTDVLETLLVYGAKTEVVNGQGELLTDVLQKKTKIKNGKIYVLALQKIKKYQKKKTKGMLFDQKTYHYLGQSLLQATHEGCVEQIEELINKGASVWYKNKQGHTPFDIASFYKNEDVCSCLSDRINLNQLFIAALLSSDNRRVNVLLSKGVHPMSYDQYETPAIVIAARTGNFEALRLLVEKGADVNVMDVNANTAMSYAIRLSDTRMMDYLFENGFMPTRVNVSYQKDLEMAIKQDSMYIMQELIENTGKTYLQTAAAMAIHYGSDRSLAYLIEKGASIKDLDTHSYSIAIEAIHSKNPKVLDQVLQQGAQINQMDAYQRWPLLEAVKSSNNEMVSVLVKHKARIDRVNNDGWTALMQACKQGDKDIVETLIRAGADINKKNRHGWTPMMINAQQGNMDIASALYKAGGRVDMVTYDHYSPLYIAVASKNTALAKHLISLGSDHVFKTDHGSKVLQAAVLSKDHIIMKKLIEHAVNVDMIDEETGKTPLMHAVELKDVESVKIILSADCDLSVQDKFGKTALRYAYDQMKGTVAHGYSNETSTIVSLLRAAEQSIVIAKYKTKHNKNICDIHQKS